MKYLRAITTNERRFSEVFTIDERRYLLHDNLVFHRIMLQNLI